MQKLTLIIVDLNHPHSLCHLYLVCIIGLLQHLKLLNNKQLSFEAKCFQFSVFKYFFSQLVMLKLKG